MPTATIFVNGQVVLAQVYASRSRVEDEMRNQRGAFNVGNGSKDNLTPTTLSNFRVTASRWADTQVRTELHADNVPIPFPIPTEIENATVARTLWLMRNRITGANRMEKPDAFANELKEEANEHIDLFIDNLDTYKDLVGKKVQITSTAIISQTPDKVLFPKVGIDGHREVARDDRGNNEPEFSKSQNLVDVTNRERS